MIMEPMAESSVGVREGVEKSKFRSGLSGKGSAFSRMRKRGEDEGSHVDVVERKQASSVARDDEGFFWSKAKGPKGPKGPNPLSVKKPKKEANGGPEHGNEHSATKVSLDPGEVDTVPEASTTAVDILEGALEEAPNPPAKRKRRRKHRSKKLELAEAAISGDESTSPNI